MKKENKKDIQIEIVKPKQRKGFQKGNSLWTKGLETRKEMKEKRINVLIDVVADGGADRYADLMSKLAEGKDINKNEAQFLDRYEKLLPYMKPKLASTEQKIEVQQTPFGLGYEEIRKNAVID